jgi:hypothetical protein
MFTRSLATLVSISALSSFALAQQWVPIVHDGFGDPGAQLATHIVQFGADAYIGTIQFDSGGRLLRSSDGIAWSLSAPLGFGNPDNFQVSAGHEFGGRLYASTANFITGGEIWRSDDGVQWEQVVSNGFGDPNALAITVTNAIGGALYATTNTFLGGARMLRSVDGVNWTEVAYDSRAFVLFGPAEFAGELYYGTGSYFEPGELWRSADGLSWSPVAQPGLGDPSVAFVSPSIVFQGFLYASTSTLGTAQGQLWRSSNGDDWQPVVTDGFGDPLTESVQAEIEFGGELYAASFNYTRGAQLWRSANGVDFTPVSPLAFGWPGTFSISACAVLHGELHAVTSHENGAQLWAMRAQPPIGAPYCSSSANSTGASATISAAGDASLTSLGFLLDASDCPAQTTGVFFYGSSQLSAPFGPGVLCVGGPHRRTTGVISSDANGRAARFVAYDQDYASGISAGGTGVNYQLWFRDPTATQPRGFNLSNALQIVHTP